jgi:flagellar biosynthesis anti-sigma factor FlgM
MRIDLSQVTSSQVSTEQDAKRVNGQQIGAAGGGSSEDRTSFTSDSSAIGPLVSTAMGSPEIRQDLVSQLKQSVASGQYQLDPSAIASAMIDEHA